MKSEVIERVTLPSFLEEQTEEATDTYRFKRKRVITLLDMIKEQLGNTLNPKFISNHRKELDTPHFVLQVRNKHKKWTIIKRLIDVIKLEQELKGKYKQKVPSVPIRKENELQQDQKHEQKMLQFCEIFCNTIGSNKRIVEEKAFSIFVQNLIPPERKKIRIFKQLTIEKRAGGRHNESSLKRILCYFINWSKRFFTITTEGLYYTLSDDDYRIEEMITFSDGFSLLYGDAETGSTYGIIVKGSHRVLSLDAGDIFRMTYFVYACRKAMKESELFGKKRYDSFAGIRQKCQAKYYVDGEGYFSDLCDTLLQAKNEVFLTGWMLSPYFCLKRPDPEERTRVDRVFEKIAKSGIKINIIIFMEPKIALNNDSQFTEDYLTSLSPNIKVLRHPAYVLIPFLWSHHQKMVIIDQKVAFLGGIDIGYGRWDDHQHRLNDQEESFWPGANYCNYRTADIVKPRNYMSCSLNRKIQPRMPWHDIGVRIKGTSVLDLTRHFVQYWNHVKIQLNMDQRELLMYTGLHEEDFHENSDKQPIEKYNPRHSRAFSPEHRKVQHSTSFHISKQKSQDNHLQRFTTFYDVQQNIDAHERQMEFYISHMKTLKSSDKLDKILKKIKDKNVFKSSRHAIDFEHLMVTQKKQDINLNEGKQYHQILRSASMWGLGLEEGQEEKSILKAYVELIYNAREYIYIENQFFISVQNTISKAIIERISRAHDQGTPFRVMVVLPSLPGFQGEIEKQESAVMRVQVHHIYETICRGQHSILRQLKYIKNLDNYIQFFTLRNHGRIHQIPVTEIVYVHSKLMIIDDQVALIGSANINDRSLMGSRDSEIAVIVEDENRESVLLANKKVREICPFAFSLRKQLYQEHFGITETESEDFLNDDVWWSIIEHAEKNQTIYRNIFGIYPDDTIKYFKDIQRVKKQADITKYEDFKNLFKGHAIPFQKYFLIKQDLSLKASQKEYFVPGINFT